jgi:hypothetical protein
MQAECVVADAIRELRSGVGSRTALPSRSSHSGPRRRGRAKCEGGAALYDDVQVMKLSVGVVSAPFL